MSCVRYFMRTFIGTFTNGHMIVVSFKFKFVKFDSEASSWMRCVDDPFTVCGIGVIGVGDIGGVVLRYLDGVTAT